MHKTTQKNLLDLVRRNYDEIAGGFSQTRANRSWPELVKLTAPVRDGDRVLDAGCGNGRLLEILSDKTVEYLGMDNSHELVKIAQAKFPNKAFLVGDILELNKLSEKDFDYLFCVAVLHHLPGQDLRVEALKQMKDKIKPDGKIVITVWNLWSQLKFRRLICKFTILKIMGKNKMDFGDILFNWKNNQGEGISRRYYHAFTKNELKVIADRAGLKLEKLYKDRYNYYAILIK